MERTVHALAQGTPAWDEFRLVHFGGSEIAAVLGLSKTTTRTELLRAKKTGIAKEFSDWLQRNVLDRGHEIEALARPLAVEFAQVDGFYPATTSIGRISASCDGIDMLDETAWECKSLNAQNGPIVRAGQVPEEHMPQCQQVLMVTGADRLLFTVSDGTRENTFHVWVEPDTTWFDRIRAAWAQFEQDLITYEPTEPVAEVVGRAPESLPALHIVLRGEVSASNLAEFKEVALTAIRSVNRDLKTDQDFADSAKARKWCEDIESRVAAAKDHALSQTASIDLLFRTMDEVSAEARDVRLALEKLEKARKESRKGEIVAGGIKALGDHVAALNTRIGRPYMPPVAADFGGAIKNMRSFDSMQNAVDTVLANAKIDASATADRIQANLATLREKAADYVSLFPDTAQIVLKPTDDLATLVTARIAEHKEKEQKRLDAERERIRAEESAKLQREQREAQEAEDALIVSFDKHAHRIEFDSVPYIEKAIGTYESTGTDWASDSRPRVAAAFLAGRAYLKERLDAAKAREQAVVPTPAQAAAAAPQEPAPAPTVIPMPSRAAAVPTSKPTLSLGQIKERIAPLQITADGLGTLGFTGQKDRGSVLFHEAEYPHILAAIVAHVQAIQAKQAA
jgi:predicted phage-related endonuclease